MSRIVHVDLGERAYDIRIGPGIRPGDILSRLGVGACLIVSDTNVDPLYGEVCERHLRSEGIRVTRSVVPAGEASKTIACLEGLYHEALAAGLERSSVVVALGGGVVGDLAGFAAATYLRGVRLLQWPTSLLAMVDSAVGGKTAVNLAEGKNLVGSFHQPVEVCADIDTLKTLPDREFASGLAEVVKYGVIWDRMLFERLEREADAVLARDAGVLEEIVSRCCEIKADVVGMDEKEANVRAILNFGHTLAHSIEAGVGYGDVCHGDAVATGMAYAAQISRTERGFPGKEAERLVSLLARFGLPTRPGEAITQVGWGKLRELMAADKKARDRVPKLVLVDKIGSVVFGCEVAERKLEDAFGAIRAAPGDTDECTSDAGGEPGEVADVGR